MTAMAPMTVNPVVGVLPGEKPGRDLSLSVVCTGNDRFGYPKARCPVQVQAQLGRSCGFGPSVYHRHTARSRQGTGIGVGGATGSSYSVNGGTYRSQPGAVANADVVRFRHTSAPAPGSGTTTILAIGGLSVAFTSTTVDDLMFGSGLE